MCSVLLGIKIARSGIRALGIASLLFWVASSLSSDSRLCLHSCLSVITHECSLRKKNRCNVAGELDTEADQPAPPSPTLSLATLEWIPRRSNYCGNLTDLLQLQRINLWRALHCCKSNSECSFHIAALPRGNLLARRAQAQARSESRDRVRFLSSIQTATLGCGFDFGSDCGQLSWLQRRVASGLPACLGCCSSACLPASSASSGGNSWLGGFGAGVKRFVICHVASF